MDVLAELKSLQCDPGPVHSPNDCPCEMEQPCTCVVIGAAIDEIVRARAALTAMVGYTATKVAEGMVDGAPELAAVRDYLRY